MTRYTAGLDLGKASDYSVLVVAERKVQLRRHGYTVLYARRWRGVSYPTVVADVGRILDSSPFSGDIRLQVDATGLGSAVLDLLDEAKHEGYLSVRELNPIIFSGANEPNPHKGSVPKRDLVSRVEVLLSEGRLRFAHDLALGPAMRDEFKNFAATVSAAGRARFEASTGHDDLVTAVALAVHEEPGVMVFSARASADVSMYDPFSSEPPSDNPFDSWPMEPD